jgi:hypothetical protein
MAKNKDPKNITKKATTADEVRKAVADAQAQAAEREQKTTGALRRTPGEGVTNVEKDKKGTVKSVTVHTRTDIVPATRTVNTPEIAPVGKPRRKKAPEVPEPGRQATESETDVWNKRKLEGERKSRAKNIAEFATSIPMGPQMSPEIEAENFARHQARQELSQAGMPLTSEGVEAKKSEIMKADQERAAWHADYSVSRKYADGPVVDSKGGAKPRWEVLGFDNAEHMIFHPETGRFPKGTSAGPGQRYGTNYPAKMPHDEWIKGHEGKLAAIAVAGRSKSEVQADANRGAAKAVADALTAAQGRIPVTDGKAIRGARAEALRKLNPLGLKKD